MLGDKTKAGFYKKQTWAEGEERLGIDWKTLEYRPRQKAKFASLEMAKNVENLPERLRMLVGMDGGKLDKSGEFLWTALSELWTYAANRIPEISDYSGRDRSRDEAGIQLGDGTVRVVGCGWGEGIGRAHEERRTCGIAECRKAARLGQDVLVLGCTGDTIDPAYFDLAHRTTSQWKSQRVFGASR